MQPDALISPAYLEQQRGLHATGRYGGRGAKWADTAVDLMRRHDCEAVLDYGCGQGSLGRELGRRGADVREYDPVIAGKDHVPRPADLVMCTDVLEHIEADRIACVLAHIRSLARKIAFFVIATRPAKKFLPDGRNAHILLRDRGWWTAQIEVAGFAVISADETKKHLIYTLR